ncbi:glycosyltransferase family 2 protein [Oceanirhabdus sp. W0125-5]|uniref:glycosyltransferase family 2 protein n=1 Tax=Oceanirhabdus sp. W0125-5 TaxID=2999116 RepID=UPI0022F319D2|nr:glycosyltransferase family 2 protein [Oceanirhabdus sp. W0125-5]WBW98949.1 glycosyltransferase family 2 protein [Oceanirhabdus sp. W0125-5]
MALLTIFTPTYNRAYCLHNCYESLERQSCKDFVWLIIDDGSTDNTKELVDKWISEKKVTIRYHRQQNQGMHGAHNTAYELIETELNTCIDSDDYMPDDGVEKIINFWQKYGSDKVSGFIGLNSNTNGNVIGTMLPKNLISSTLFDLYYKHGVTGDKKLIYRTELTKQYPYPVFNNERYVGLAYKYYMLDKDYEMLLMNKVVCCVEYLPDGSSMNMLRQYRTNPKGFAFYRKELMKLPFVSLKFKFRQAIHYVSSSILIRNKKFIEESPCKILTIIAIPFGFLLNRYILINTKV